MNRLGDLARRTRFRVEDVIGSVLFRIAGAISLRGRRPPVVSPRRILILQLQQLGDSVIFTPTLRALREHFPQARIELLATSVAAQIYKKSPYIDEVHVARRWTPGRAGARVLPLLPLLRRLRAARYDCTIADVTEQSFRYTIVAWLLGSPLRAGFDIRGRGFLHNLVVPYREDETWVEANLSIARSLGATPSSAREEVAYEASDRDRVRQLLAERGHGVEQKIVVIHTGTNWQSRTWYDDRWATVADALGRSSGATLVFVGSAAEHEDIERIRATMSEPSVSLAGVTDIPQLAALCAMADLIVGTDSGPRHIARASGCPHVVVMCSQDDTDQWLGWGPGEIVMRSLPACSGCYYAHCSHKLCMDAIEPDAVLTECQRLLAAANARGDAPRHVQPQIPVRLSALASLGKAALRTMAQMPANTANAKFGGPPFAIEITAKTPNAASGDR
jgi:heptosyltransferase-2